MIRYGFVGLGQLGAALAGRLKAAGFGLVVYDLNKALAEPLVAAGADWADSLADLAARVDHVVTCLPSPVASEAVLALLLPAMKLGASWIECSTLGRDDVLRLAALAEAHGMRMLECPVTGGVHLAARGEVTVLVGGDVDLLALHRPALDAMGNRLFHMGPLGSAAVIKVITNMLAFIHLVADGEALMLAKRGGLDLGTAWRAIAASSGSSFVHETEGQLILNGSYDVGFSMDLALKDLGFALGMGQATGVPLALATAVEARFREGRETFGGTAQSTRIVQLLEDAVGEPLRADGFPARLV